VLMPQKRNPYALSILRGAAGSLIGRLAGLLAVAKTPSARSDNLIFAYGEVPRALDLALRATRLSTGVVRTLEVNAERMRSALESGFSQATDLAEYIMQACGIDYRSAYRVVGHAVRQASTAGLRGADIDGAVLDAAATEITGRPLGLAGRDLSAVLDPWQIVASRTALGGAAPGEVPRALDLALRATRLSTGLIRTLQVNAERMRTALDSGFSQATDLAEYIMQSCAIDYRSAYRIVGHAVRQASAAGLAGADIDGAMLDAAAAEVTGRPLGLAGRDLSAALDPWQIVASRTALGGAAPGEVRRMAAEADAEASRLAGEARRWRDTYRAAEDALLESARKGAQP